MILWYRTHPPPSLISNALLLVWYVIVLLRPEGTDVARSLDVAATLFEQVKPLA